MAAAGTACTAVARADPALAPSWYFLNGARTKAEADFPSPSLRLSYACEFERTKALFESNYTQQIYCFIS
jgi:hypothetical protein